MTRPPLSSNLAMLTGWSLIKTALYSRKWLSELSLAGKNKLVVVKSSGDINIVAVRQAYTVTIQESFQERFSRSVILQSIQIGLVENNTAQ